MLRRRFFLRASQLLEFSHGVFDGAVLRVHRRAVRLDQLHLDEAIETRLDAAGVSAELGSDVGLQESFGLVLLEAQQANDFFVEGVTLELRLGALVVARRRAARRGSFRRTSLGRSRNGNRFASFGARVRL